MSSIRENLRRGRSHLIIAGTLAIFGPMIVAIEDRELQEQAGKAPPKHGGIVGAVGGQLGDQPSAPAVPIPSGTTATPQPEATTAIAPKASPSGAGWQVQLGAYARERDAQRHLATVRAAIPELATAEATTENGGPLLRLRLNGYGSRGDAVRDCEALRSAGFACFVPPRP